MSETILFLDRATTDRGDLDFSGIEALGELTSFPTSNRDETLQRITGANIVLTNKAVVGAAEMDAAKNLKLIQVVATGVNNIDLEAARERGLAVCNVSGYSTEAVAQHVFASLLNLMTNVHRFAANRKNGRNLPSSPVSIIPSLNSPEKPSASSDSGRSAAPSPASLQPSG
jgi:glycerate dehydrogenase